MGIIAWIIFGLLAGWVAKALMPGRDPGGCIITMVIGVVGAILGGWIGSQFLGAGPVTGFNIKSFLLAVMGSIILLLLYRLIAGRRTVV
jgi:uncharacterized membrane protein YeaQ/YmgE (transglycosylase-associated protein family)